MNTSESTSEKHAYDPRTSALVRDYNAAVASQQYRKAVIAEAFGSYEKARPQRRARQGGQQMVVKPLEANPIERR